MVNKEAFVPIEDMAEHFTVSVSTIRAWVRRGHIPPAAYIKVGPTYRFRISDVTNSLLASGANGDPTEDFVVSAPSIQQESEARVESYVERKVLSTLDCSDVRSDTDEAVDAVIDDLFDEDM
tara:strand:- start:4808 stop:5173 length:366 start_codon:yes stop_codon:yes gene_type:complete